MILPWLLVANWLLAGCWLVECWLLPAGCRLAAGRLLLAGCWLAAACWLLAGWQVPGWLMAGCWLDDAAWVIAGKLLAECCWLAECRLPAASKTKIHCRQCSRVNNTPRLKIFIQGQELSWSHPNPFVATSSFQGLLWTFLSCILREQIRFGTPEYSI